VAPQRPRIEHRSTQVLPGNNVTARAGEKTIVKCLSRYGNPPAKLKWFLGETELSGNQSNNPEMDNPRTWVASSAVEVTLDKVQHGRSLRCVALHESYPTKAQSVDVRLDVTCEYASIYLQHQAVIKLLLDSCQVGGQTSVKTCLKPNFISMLTKKCIVILSVTSEK
ncbi:hypothetical protein AAG570_001409, partial [Ranatra chinensis]